MKTIIYSTALLFILSCGNQSTEESTTETARTSQSIDKKTSGCFEKFDDRYEELLSRSDIEGIISIDDSTYEMETSSYGSVQHQWKSDRPDLEFIIAGQSIKGPDRNRIVLKNLKLYDSTDVTYIRDSFETSYKKLSEEEYQQLLLNIEKTYENDATGLARAKGFLDARLHLVYEALDGLGDAAYWKWDEQHGIELAVLFGDTHFIIENKTAVSKEENLEIARQLAEKVIEKCM